MSTTKATAAGKVILFGEHAVVYGVPAIAVGIDRGAWATTAPATSAGRSTLHVTDWGAVVTDEPGDDAPLARAFRALVAVTRRETTLAALDVTAGADLPPGGGLGCSAALGVAVARALDPAASADVVALRGERLGAGLPRQPLRRRRRGGGARRVRPLRARAREGSRSSIERVQASGPLHLCVGSTGVRPRAPSRWSRRWRVTGNGGRRSRRRPSTRFGTRS
jgi:mevalonate kinase